MSTRHTLARTRRSAALAAVGGALAAGAALAVAELLAGLLPGAPSLVVAVGDAVIDLQPPGAKDLVVSLFGEADKLALEATIVLAALAIAATLAVVSRRRRRVAEAGFVAAGIVGAAAALADAQVSAVLAILSAGVAVAVGIAVLRALVPSPAPTQADGAAAMPDWSRRSFLGRAAVVAAGSLVAATAGRALLAAGRSAVRVAGSYPPASRTATLPAGSSVDVAGISPVVVPNDRFYRIDTALLVPRVDAATWSLRVHGLVERETTLSFDELLRLPLLEQYVTIACVSNEVGGDLVGNAKWTGVRLREVLDIAGVRPEATQLVGRANDGWTAGMPTAWIMDRAREPMIAVLMNDEPLPPAHGYPARLIVPGLFGYVSATKWLAELELTTWEAFDGYWVPLGWAKEGPILTQSRIDVPRNGAVVRGSRVSVAGVAWAPDRGIRRVEVAVDGEWREATLATPISEATWVQWRIDVAATPGPHELRVRATDGLGEVQPEERTRPAPDGARGHHTIAIEVDPA